MAQPVMWGRDDSIDRVARSRAPLLLVTGDSGIGKSALIAHAADRCSGDGLANAPVRILHSETASRAVLRALAVVAADVAATADIADVMRGLLNSASRLADRYGNQLPQVLAMTALGFVKAQLGDQVAAVAEDFLAEARQNSPAGVASAVSAEVDPLASEVIVGFTVQLLSFAQGRRMRLFLDGGERLGEHDRKILADLAVSLPDQVHLIVAHRTSSRDELAMVAELDQVGPQVARLELSPLAASDVGAWLGTEGLDSNLAVSALRRTGGYPLHVADLIHHLHQGGTVATAPLHDSFIQAANASWHSLNDKDRRSAARLAVLSDPLEGDYAALLDAAADPVSLEENLSAARIFSVDVGGRLWFHEERRAGILKSIASGERAAYHKAAADFIWSSIQDSATSTLLSELSIQVEGAASLLDENQDLATVVKLSDLELSVLAALIELAEPSNEFAVDGQPLLQHWRQRWQRAGDPVAALESLKGKSFIVLAQNDRAAVAIPLLAGMVQGTVIGLIVRRLALSPIQALGSQVFEAALRVPLGHFDVGTHGSGDPNAAYLSQAVAEGAVENDELLGLFGLARFDSTPMFFAAAYETEARLESALKATRGLAVDLLGKRLEVERVEEYPLDRQPDLFLLAAEFVMGSSPIVRPGGRFEVDLPAPMQIEDWLRARVETIGVMRGLASPEEQLALDLLRPWGLMWELDESDYIELSVRGGDEAATRLALPPGAKAHPFRLLSDPFALFRLGSLAQLPQTAEIRQVSTGQPNLHVDPVLLELGRITNRLVAFNRLQPRLLFALDPEDLQEEIGEAQTTAMERGRRLASLVRLGGVWVEPPPPTLTCVLVLLDPPNPGLVADARGLVLVKRLQGRVDDDEVRVHVTLGSPGGASWIASVAIPPEFDFEQAFGTPAEPDQAFSSVSTLHVGLANLLGFRREDVTFAWPDEI